MALLFPRLFLSLTIFHSTFLIFFLYSHSLIPFLYSHSLHLFTFHLFINLTSTRPSQQFLKPILFTRNVLRFLPHPPPSLGAHLGVHSPYCSQHSPPARHRPLVPSPNSQRAWESRCVNIPFISQVTETPRPLEAKSNKGADGDATKGHLHHTCCSGFWQNDVTMDHTDLWCSADVRLEITLLFVLPSARHCIIITFQELGTVDTSLAMCTPPFS
ncbi:hypothetical protein E2C01_099185 [Portunus trituberculatus]|uniref:Uncharacterized protein n=1 Tax=Portunus trituberculatus TaxID=210409 RepID=A0A5B7KA68_PORTR|nr:hypothetical protein [Portunus trituberculatus]